MQEYWRKTVKQSKFNRFIIQYLFSFLLCLFLSDQSHSSAYKSFGKVWNNTGGTSVSTSPQMYKGQKAGHYTLGSMYFARESKNRPLMSVRFPEIDFDKSCYAQGVLNFGGISFISADELMNKLQSIVTQAGMMFVYQGISSISPVIGETLQEVYSKLQEVGGFLANECQAAKTINGIAGDLLTQHNSLAQNLVTKVGLSTGSSSDLSAAYRDYPKNRTQELSKAAAKDDSLILEDINLAWKALEKLNIQDYELKKFMMSISGTIIIHAPSSNNSIPQFQYISSNITNPSLLKALLKGGDDLPVLECSDHAKCLSVQNSVQRIDKKDSFEYKVAEYFSRFRTAIQNDEDISDKQSNADIHSFLSSSGLPVYKIYDVLYQYTNANPEYEQGVFIELVAWNILYNYLSDTLKQVTEATNNLKLAAAPQIAEFKASLIRTQKMLNDLEMKDLSRYKMQIFLINRAENYEKVMADEVSQIYSMRY